MTVTHAMPPPMPAQGSSPPMGRCRSLRAASSKVAATHGTLAAHGIAAHGMTAPQAAHGIATINMRAVDHGAATSCKVTAANGIATAHWIAAAHKMTAAYAPPPPVTRSSPPMG